MSDITAPPASFASGFDQIHDVATDLAGAADFGADDYQPGLQMLLESLDYDPHFTPYGRQYAWNTVASALAARARAHAQMAANPGYSGNQIISPVIITGIPRSGTTALHRLLAVDPRFQGLQAWITDYPMPRPPVNEWQQQPGFHAMVAKLEQRLRDAPGKKAAHDMAADAVDECCLILRQGFVSNIWTMGWSSASYDAWWQSASEAASYAHFRRCLQLIGLNEPDKRWLLKNPGHIDQPDLLFDKFPDAKVIVTHRDPAKAIPSLTNMLLQAHDRIEDGRREARGRILLRREAVKWAKASAKMRAAATHRTDQVMDVVHGDFHANPMAVVDAIYRFIGWDLPDDILAAIACRAADRPELAHGVHRYDIADYGCNNDALRAMFGDYVQRYDLLEARP